MRHLCASCGARPDRSIRAAASVDQLQRDGVLVDILVNNAGYGISGEFAQMPEPEILGQIQLNITALTLLTKLFLAPMLQRGSGKIMNVASIAAFQPGPLIAVYYASKAYVLSFSEALANELRGSGATITCFCPGPTHTNFQKRAQMENSRLFKRIGAMDARTVARDGYRGLMARTPGRHLGMAQLAGCRIRPLRAATNGDRDLPLDRGEG